MTSVTSRVYAYADSKDVATSVGEHILKLQDQSLKQSGRFKIAVSGGSLGKVLKKALIDNGDIAPRVQWSQWQVFFSDERLVPLDHADSNYGLFHEMVVKNLPPTAGKPEIFTIDESLVTGKDGLKGGADFNQDQAISEAYEKIVAAAHGKLDLILLGCGPDGHTCSLFPGHKLLHERSKLVAYIGDSPKPPPRRITFTLPVLENATSIAFVAEGAGKAPVLKEIFNDEASQLPCKLVNDLNLGVQVSWFVDHSAINGVDVMTSKY